MSIFDYHCTWCKKSFKRSSVTEVTNINSTMIDQLLLERELKGDKKLYHDMFTCLNIPKPNWSIRLLHAYLCKSCAKKYEDTLLQIQKAWLENDKVELVSSNYRGRKKYDWDCIPLNIETTYERDWNYAKKLLRTLALYEGYDMVIDVRQDKKTEEEESDSGRGTHYYTVVSYSGTAVRKFKNVFSI